MTSPYSQAALPLWDKGWRGILHLGTGQKYPPPTGMTGAEGSDPSYADVYARTEDDCYNIALRLPRNVIGIDVDAYDGKPGWATFTQSVATYGVLPATWIVTSRLDGMSGIRLYRTPEGLAYPGELGPGVEIIQYRHRYVVAPPSIHPSGLPYRWIGPDGLPCEAPCPGDLPPLPDAWVIALTRGEMEQQHTRVDLTDATQRQTIRGAFRGGPACGAVRTVLARGTADLERAEAGSRHETARPVVLALVAMGVAGHTGALDALKTLEGVFLRVVTSGAGSRTQEAAGDEWVRLVRGATAMAGSGAAPGHSTHDPCDRLAGIVMPDDMADALDPLGVALDEPRAPSTGGDNPVDALLGNAFTFDPSDVYYYMRKMAAQTEARRLLAQQDFDGSRLPEIVAADVMLSQPETEIDWVLRDLMPVGSNLLITAAFKAGKTTLVNNMIASLVDVRPFLNHFKVERDDRTIALLNYEMDTSMLARWLRDTGIVAAQRLSVINLRGYNYPLHQPNVLDHLTRTLTPLGITTIVIDPFARALGSLSENDNSDVKTFTDAIDELKARVGATESVLVAHTGRMQHEIGAERARGATRLDDWADGRIIITKDEEGQRYFRATGRDVEVEEAPLTFDPLMRTLTLSDGEGRKARRSNGPAVTLGALQNLIVGQVERTPGTGSGEVKARLRSDRVSFRDELFNAALSGLVNAQRLVQIDQGKGLARRLYRWEDQP